jgi:hypothetical protein
MTRFYHLPIFFFPLFWSLVFSIMFVFVGSAKVLKRLAALAKVAEIMNNSDSDIF